jgi:plastocyanin
MSRDVAMSGVARRIGFVSVLALWVLSLGGPAYAANHTVSMAGISFSPGVLTVHVGDTVTWVHDASATPHSVTADDGSFDSSPNCPPTCLGANSTFQHTFDTAGTFPYHCRIHGAAGGIGMSGTIIVQAVAVTTTTKPAPATTVPTAVSPGPATTVPAGTPTTQPAAAAASGTSAAAAGTTSAPAPTLAFTGSRTGLVSLVGALCLILGLALLRVRRD